MDMDMISNLPDEIVCHILSFLPTKEAALTFVLSKRWRNLFTFTPNLDFDDADCLNLNKNYTGFVEHVDRVLAVSGNSPLKKFTLRHRQKFDESRVNSWICNALSRGVLDLDLFLILKDGYSLPFELFSCNTIVKMKLGSWFRITSIPVNASLPALKTLVLGCIEFSGCAFEALISACHVLKELTLVSLIWDHEKCCTVSCPTLERLFINCKLSRPIAFDTPRLVYLDYCGFVENDPTVNLESIVEAKLSLYLETFSKYNPTNLINGLRNVKILCLSSYKTSEIFYSSAEAIPVFENLSHLTIATKLGSCWNLVPLLLENSPNLETLVIKGPLHFYRSYEEEYESICKCLCGYSFLMACPVKVLEITEYRGTKRDLSQMKHFFEKLRCLELVKVHACAILKLPVDKDLLMLPRPCEIQLINFVP